MTPNGKLCDVLQASLDHCCGTRRFISELRRVPSAYRTSFGIEELEVRLDDGTELHLILKDLSQHSLAEEARNVKPPFLYDPLREIETYEKILSHSSLGTATFYGSHTDAANNRYWLFLESVSGVELYQTGDLAVWQEAARWLARMHEDLNLDNRLVRGVSRLLHYDAAFYSEWLERAIQFSHGTARDRLQKLALGYGAVIERLLGLPYSFIHGEFYASNVLVREEASPLVICPIDWEMAAIGPGLMDVAALTGGKWNEETRRAIALAYLKATTAVMPVDVFLESVEYCRLHQCVQWIGWAKNWSAPPEHAQDWLGEALRIAERLGL